MMPTFFTASCGMSNGCTSSISLAARVIFEQYTENDYTLEAIGLKRTVTAFTDNEIVVINAGHPLIQKQLRRSDRHYCVMGMGCHEFAHCLVE